MPQFVCDFVEIVGDSPITIGDSKTLWEGKFSTKGFPSGFPAFLMLNVRGLTYSNFDVDVVVNNLSVGKIFHYGGVTDADRNETAKHWYTQMISVGGATLKDGVENEIQIQAVKNPSPTVNDTYDDFAIKNVVCFFKKTV